MADYEQEQEMELEALQAILMDDIKEIDPSESGIDTNSRCFEILLSPQDDDFDEAAHVPVQMALVLHTEKYQMSLHCEYQKKGAGTVAEEEEEEEEDIEFDDDFEV
ncbi:hypothetical protein ZWY2020_011057 [Hordeum vulgare]|nr:hypothetical protein ZWY2020_011057 [Hordeum vulgare]